MLLLACLLLGASLAPSEPIVYHLVIEEGSWAEYEVLEAGDVMIYGIVIPEGSLINFCLSGSEVLPVNWPYGRETLRAEWPLCDVYLDGDLIAKNASTYLIRPFWPAEGGFWEALAELEDENARVELKGDVVLVELRVYQPGFSLRWEVRKSDGLTLHYELAGPEGDVELSMELEESRLNKPKSNGRASSQPDYLASCILAAAAVVAIAGLASLATRGGAEWS